jgi:uncharacterized repeat protein (TIGR01451 family)
VQVEKVGPATHNIGTPFTYEIIVRNPGAAALAGVRVEERMPGTVRVLGAEPLAEIQGDTLRWNLGTLEPQGERRIQVQVESSSEGDFEPQTLATFSAAAMLRTRLTKPGLNVTKSGPQMVQVGDKVPFTLQVSNPGSGPVNNVVLHDDMPRGLQHPAGEKIEADVGTLAAGQSKTVQLEATAMQPGKFINTVTATAAGGLQSSAQSEVTVIQGALQVRKTGPTQSLLQREVEHWLEVSNPATVPATNVQLIDVLPQGLDFISASAGGVFDPQTRTCTWNIGTLAPGQGAAVTIKSLARSAGEWVNQAYARADRGLEARAEQPVNVEGVPALMLEVVDLDDPVEVGNETTYEIRVVNQGNRPCHNVRISSVVPLGLTPLKGEGPAQAKIQGQQVIFDPAPKLAAKSDFIYRVRVKGKQKGDWRFAAQMTCDQLQKPVYEEESTQVYSDFGTPAPR